MKIVEIEPIQLPGTLLVKVTTDAGLVGWGECSPIQDLQVVAEHVRGSLAPLAIGLDPFGVEHLVEYLQQRTYKIAGQTQAMALSGIEIACWDLMGQALEQPVHVLLGGAYRTEIPFYGSSMRRDIGPEDEAERLLAARERYGYEAFKVRVGSGYTLAAGGNADAAPKRSEAVIRRCVEALDGTAELMADANSSYSPARAIRMGRFLEDQGVIHFEEPCPYTDLAATARVASHLDVPVAGGEQEFDLHRFRDLLVTGAVDVLQPDLIKCGGFTVARKVAALAQSFSTPISIHNGYPLLGTIASLHFAAATPVCRERHEMTLEPHPHEADLFYPPVQVRAGHVAVPTRPGLGVAMNEEYIASQRTDR